MENKITDIHCPNCGAPAKYDIISQEYLCGNCKGRVGIYEAQQQKKGFRKLRGDQISTSLKNYRLFHAACGGCGADLVFEENEALSSCPFCGRSLVRSEYLKSNNMPESVIPFSVTKEEAGKLLEDWCHANKRRPESAKLLPLCGQLNGFYLPYELLEGPVHMTVSRMDGFRKYRCEGCIHDALVNRSSQMDNLLLDGMEPYDLAQLKEFDYGYVAGQRVKISDIPDKVLEERVREESAQTYTPAVRKVLETRAVEVEADVGSAVRLPVLLPVYYICQGDLMAAVNGQTGKVSVRALKESHYYFLPWWLKAILATLAICGIFCGALMLFGMNMGGSLFMAGMLGLILLIVALCLYSDTVHNRFSVESGRAIYTSGKQSFVREKGKLVLRDEILERKTDQPVFFEKVKGTEQPVVLKFTSPPRVVRMVLLCVIALFLPVIVALFLNGFHFQSLHLGGSAAWFCLAVPVVPVYLLKFGIVDLHDNPWIYIRNRKGKLKRCREKGFKGITKDHVIAFLRALFIPPVSLAVWFGILSFCVMCYLTAFGFD